MQGPSYFFPCPHAVPRWIRAYSSQEFWAMTYAKRRRCRRAAAADPYCDASASDSIAKALNPSRASVAKSPRPDRQEPPLPPLSSVSPSESARWS